MTNQTLIGHMCKSMRAMGLSRRREHTVEDHISKMLTSSGPEYVISYLKELKDYHLQRASGIKEPELAPWHRKDSKGRPTDWQACLTFRKPSTSVQIINAAINAISFTTVTDKQYKKWRSGVRCMSLGKDASSQRSNFTDPKMGSIYLGFGDCISVDRRLAEEVANNSLFQPSHISCRIVPFLNGGFTNILNSDKRTINLNNLLSGYIGTINSAPAVAGQMEIDLIQSVERFYPELEIVDKEQRLELAHHIVKRGRNLTSFIDDFYVPNTEDVDYSLFAGCEQQLGTIAFMQEPGGKLRTAANPNQYLQHICKPFQKALQHSYSFFGTAICVNDQKKGIDWAQRQLIQGEKLFSGDLSAATDTIGVAGQAEQLHKFYCTESLDRRINREEDIQSPLSLSIDQYETLSRMNWYNPATHDEIAWSQGQPMGLRPSFPWFTICHALSVANCIMTVKINESGPPKDPAKFIQECFDSFSLCGDDVIMKSLFADTYCKVITKQGGNINREKCMDSSIAAEFCSQLITRNSITPIKPKIGKYYTTVFTDLEKAPLSSMIEGKMIRDKDIEIARTLSSWSTDELSHLPHMRTKENRHPFNLRLAINQALEQIASEQNILGMKNDINLISLPSLSLMRVKSHYKSDVRVRHLSWTKYIPELEFYSDPQFRLVVSEGPFAKFDWKSKGYSTPVNPYTQAKRLANVLNTLTFDKDDLERGDRTDSEGRPTIICCEHICPDKYGDYTLLFDQENGEMSLWKSIPIQGQPYFVEVMSGTSGLHPVDSRNPSIITAIVHTGDSDNSDIIQIEDGKYDWLVEKINKINHKSATKLRIPMSNARTDGSDTPSTSQLNINTKGGHTNESKSHCSSQCNRRRKDDQIEI